MKNMNQYPGESHFTEWLPGMADWSGGAGQAVGQSTLSVYPSPGGFYTINFRELVNCI